MEAIGLALTPFEACALDHGLTILTKLTSDSYDKISNIHQRHLVVVLERLRLEIERVEQEATDEVKP